MQPYHKINSLYKRDPNNIKRLIIGDYACPEFEYLKDNEWVFTEKVDGTNIRVMIEKGPNPKITFGGKSDNAQIPAKLVTKLQERFFLHPKIFTFENSLCLYGEGYGASIQKGGGNYRPDVDFVLFDVKIDDWWLRRSDVEDIAYKLDLDIVPIVGKGMLTYMEEIVREGFDSQWGPFKAEGLIAKPAVELKNRAGQRIITKLKHKDFQYAF